VDPVPPALNPHGSASVVIAVVAAKPAKQFAPDATVLAARNLQYSNSCSLQRFGGQRREGVEGDDLVERGERLQSLLREGSGKVGKQEEEGGESNENCCERERERDR